MTTHSASRKSARAHGRIASVLAYDGAVATTLLKAFQFFVLSVSFVAGIAPAIVFSLLVGWQNTHLAIWLGAASVLTIVPAAYGALAAAQRELLVPGGSRAGREFWHSFAFAFRRLWWLAASAVALTLVLAYDFAITGGDDAALLAMAAAAIAAALLTVGACCVAIDTGCTSAVDLIVSTVRSIARRPHIALSWGMLIALGMVSITIPVIGTAATLFAPAVVAAAIVICNTTLGFAREPEEPRS